jgi:hypothetical protein
MMLAASSNTVFVTWIIRPIPVFRKSAASLGVELIMRTMLRGASSSAARDLRKLLVSDKA